MQMILMNGLKIGLINKYMFDYIMIILTLMVHLFMTLCGLKVFTEQLFIT